MKTQTMEILNNATDVQNEIDALIRQFNFTYKSEAQLALEADPFLPARERLRESDLKVLEKVGDNAERQADIFARSDDTFRRPMIEMFRDGVDCGLCKYIETKDDPMWTGRRQKMNGQVARDNHSIYIPYFDDEDHEYWGIENPIDLTDEDFRL